LISFVDHDMFICYISRGVGNCVINSTQGTEDEKSMNLSVGDDDNCEAAAEE